MPILAGKNEAHFAIGGRFKVFKVGDHDRFAFSDVAGQRIYIGVLRLL